ncbi:hypothetical protein OC845_001720 [Tilletia horrida]|nr:hypothetical protein OC845_001720 [Tilletia horrida]
MPDAASSPSHDFSFTLQVKSKGYRRTRNTRTFMCAADGNSYSTHALEWLLDNLVEDGDEVVALRVLDAANSAGPGSDNSDSEEEAHDDKRLEEYREEANELLRSIEDLNDEMGGDRRISIVVEFVSADPRRRTLTTSITSTVVRLIHMYRPDSITIGTRGKNATLMQKMMMGAGFSNSVVVGSVSREILSRSPVPVIVVRPENKVEKHLKKRQADPKRRSYHDLMAKSLHHHHHHHNHHQPHQQQSPGSSKRTTSGSSVNSASSASSSLAPPPPPSKTGQVTVASPLSASFGPEVSKGEDKDKASTTEKAPLATVTHGSTSSTSASSTSSSATASSASSTSDPSASAETTADPSTLANPTTITTTTNNNKESSAAAIAKRKPSLKVFEREQHPAGQESPRSPTTHTSKSFTSIASALSSSSPSSSSPSASASVSNSADSSFADEATRDEEDGSAHIRGRTLFQEPIAEEEDATAAAAK